jgi:cytochrome P450
MDTILIASEWAMSEVLRNPEVLAKAQAELDSVVGQQRRVQESDIPNLDYIQAIVKEGHGAPPVHPRMQGIWVRHPC